MTPSFPSRRPSDLVHLLKGARATGIDRTDDGVVVRCDDGRVPAGSHALLAIGSIPNSEGLGLELAGVEVDRGGYVPVDQACRTNRSEEHTSELQSLMRISYADFCLKTKKQE